MENPKSVSPQGYVFGMLPVNDNPFWGDGTPEGHGLPPGGTDGQVLTKTGAEDYAAEWKDPKSQLPSGGNAGDVLTKTTENDIAWMPPKGGGGGGDYAWRLLNDLTEAGFNGYKKIEVTETSATFKLPWSMADEKIIKASPMLLIRSGNSGANFQYFLPMVPDKTETDGGWASANFNQIKSAGANLKTSGSIRITLDFEAHAFRVELQGLLTSTGGYYVNFQAIPVIYTEAKPV